jgi:SAM-dependent methyltransferase
MSGACRACGAPLEHVFVDLGRSPVANALRHPDQPARDEAWFPLRTYVCDQCKLVQLQDFRAPDDLFGAEYTYFSSYSKSWLRHAETYVGMMVERFGFGPGHKVIEIASNDGYLLRYFKARGIDVLGVEPSANVAAAALRDHGIPSVRRFFGAATARDLRDEGRLGDLVLGNNVLAHVPDINDFVAGIPMILKPDGIATFEFPHLLELIEGGYFDTIYHEHFSYLSLMAVEAIFNRHGLALFDVEELPTHGGSLRIFVRHVGGAPAASDRLTAARAREDRAGLGGRAAYDGFAERVRAAKRRLRDALIALKAAGASVIGYGAPAKGNTLLNYCGIGTEFLDYTVDRSPHKQGMLLPGSGIPILDPARIRETKPDYVLILPWNLTEEIIGDLDYIRDWGGRFIIPLPEVRMC